MSITSNSGSQITLTEALALVKAFRTNYSKEIKASFVGKNNLNLILQQEDCIGIRVYYGYDESLGRLSPVLVGVDASGKDMTAGPIIDKMKPCPDDCDITSALFK